MSEWQFILDESSPPDPNDAEFEIHARERSGVECYVTREGITIRLEDEGIQLHISRRIALEWADNLQLAASVSNSQHRAYFDQLIRKPIL